MAINKRKTPEVNAGSMADIAFLLLIFFLVATTMNVDSGINRVLPPWNDKPQNAPDIRERNLFYVHVNKFDQIAAQNELVQITELKDKTKQFILNIGDDDNMPEKKIVDIPGIGKYAVSEGVVSLQNDRGTSYEIYIMVQNELTRAFNEIRDELSMEKFSVKFADLTDEEQRNAIVAAVPLKISEAEPQNIGGK